MRTITSCWRMGTHRALGARAIRGGSRGRSRRPTHVRVHDRAGDDLALEEGQGGADLAGGVLEGTRAVGAAEARRRDSSARMCHRMFGVWAQAGRLHEADTMFEQMRHASEEMRAYGNDLASHWLGADLDAVRDILSSTNLDKRLMCHSTSSYVRMITACIRAGDSHRARSYLTALEREADDKAIVLGHEATTPLLFTLCRGPTTTARRRRPSHACLRAEPAVRARAVAHAVQHAHEAGPSRRGCARAAADVDAGARDCMGVRVAHTARRGPPPRV